MEIHGQGIYKSGVIQPEQPLELPDNTRVRFVLVPEGELQGPGEIATQPNRITGDELDELIRQYGVAVGTLPLPTDDEDRLTKTEQSPNGLLSERPKAPRITPEELMERIRKYSFSAPSLPADFSREDIYNDDD